MVKDWKQAPWPHIGKGLYTVILTNRLQLKLQLCLVLHMRVKAYQTTQTGRTPSGLHNRTPLMETKVPVKPSVPRRNRDEALQSAAATRTCHWYHLRLTIVSVQEGPFLIKVECWVYIPDLSGCIWLHPR